MPTNVSTKIVTAKQLFELPPDGSCYELIKGQLQMMSPAGGRHGRLANCNSWLLTCHVTTNDLGVVFAAETGFRIETEPDTVLAPDVAFVSRARYEQIVDDSGYVPFAPDMAVEVLSPNDRFTRVETKALTWLDAGCKLVLVVDPDSQTIHAYRSRQQIQIFELSETLNCTEAVPGWTPSVAQLLQG